MGFSFAAGINLYATVAILGLAKRYGWVDLPTSSASSTTTSSSARHRPLRRRVRRRQDPVGRLGVGRRAHGHPADRRRRHRRRDARRRQPDDGGVVALLGGGARRRHALHQGGTRAVANTSPEPFSNWILSLAEDVFVVGLGCSR